MTTIDSKRQLLVLKGAQCLNESIDKSDLMLLMNIAWNKSFARIDKNRRVIADRVWGQYNRSILIFSQIRSTITDGYYLKDIKYHIN